jgi:hypothetical protein
LRALEKTARTIDSTALTLHDEGGAIGLSPQAFWFGMQA